jgi:hypothetical protein
MLSKAPQGSHRAPLAQIVGALNPSGSPWATPRPLGSLGPEAIGALPQGSPMLPSAPQGSHEAPPGPAWGSPEAPREPLEHLPERITTVICAAPTRVTPKNIGSARFKHAAPTGNIKKL